MSYLVSKDEVLTVWDCWKREKISADETEQILCVAQKVLSELNPNDNEIGNNDVCKIFEGIKVGEDILEAVFSEIRKHHTANVVSASLLLDSIYHTQTHNALAFAIDLESLLKGTLLNDILNAKDEESEICTRASCIHQIANLQKDETNRFAYSFATKFCNWINPQAFPIFDSYVAWLLNGCTQKGFIKLKPCRRKSLGYYDKFIEAYNYFKNNVVDKGADLNYKQLDAFMWTIGKIIGRQSSIAYGRPEGSKQ